MLLSGTGQSVLIQRLTYELQKAGELVFIFNMGDKELRDMLRVLPADHYDITGIAPHHPHRLHWNPLQIGRRIDPDTHLDTVVKSISNAGGLGGKQREILSQALRNLYVELSALTNDPDLWAHPQWGKLYPDDMQALDKEHQRRGLSLRTGTSVTLKELEDWEQQAVAVWRSQRASFLRLYQLIDALQNRRNIYGIDPVEGLKERIRPLTRRNVDPAQWLRQDEGPVPLDAYRDRFPNGGVVVIEGGGFANSYIKSVWFGLAIALLCQDAKMRFSNSEAEDPGARQRFTLIIAETDQLTTAGATVDDKNRGYDPFAGLLLGMAKYGGRVILGRANESIPKDLKLHLAHLDIPYLPLTQFIKGELPLSNRVHISEIVDALIDTRRDAAISEMLNALWEDQKRAAEISKIIADALDDEQRYAAAIKFVKAQIAAQSES